MARSKTPYDPEFAAAALRAGYAEPSITRIARDANLSTRTVGSVMAGRTDIAGPVAIAKIRGVLGLPLAPDGSGK